MPSHRFREVLVLDLRPADGLPSGAVDVGARIGSPDRFPQKTFWAPVRSSGDHVDLHGADGTHRGAPVVFFAFDILMLGRRHHRSMSALP